jgi:DNA-binding beta-propeller fold protein YncE
MRTLIKLAAGAAALMASGFMAATLHAQTAPKFEVDATWPKDLPAGWITGQLGGVCTDADDNVYVVNRRDITEEEKETAKSAPSIIKFDPAGNVVASWGEPNVVPGSIHGCYADRERNLWVGGNNDGIIQKYAPDGKLLLQIGTRGKFDSSDGTAKGKGLNANPQQFFNPAGIAIDEANGDIYVADGYGNRRVVVFDSAGKFLRQWGHQATKAETEAGEPAAFSEVVHCIALSRAGLVYVCDRQGDRVQVFDKSGKFVRNIWIRTGTAELPDPRGTAWWVSFSPDSEQKFMYVMNGRNEQVHVLDHASGKILASFGRPGHQIGNFTHGHTMAIDSKGNLYVAETNFGRRIQKFKIVSAP